MRAVMIMFDTLTRRYLEPYGNSWVQTPNFRRLAERTQVFDRFYGGSMPCMPARRELHTGRYNHCHRAWGPLEPFDESVIERMSSQGIYTHLVTDHSHYFEDGGCTYHNRYCTWEGFRGQEGDRWVPRKAADMELNGNRNNKQGLSVEQHMANRSRMEEEAKMPSVRTIDAGLEFLSQYETEDNWFLQIECFDPHEPFYVPEKYRRMYECRDCREAYNWPCYQPVDSKITEEDLENLRREYGALLTMCDYHLGRILDFLDEHNMWENTLIIVNTDHGFFLGEKGYLGKNYPPMYDEMVHIPFFISYPGCEPGRRNALAQTIDIAPTLLEYFGVECSHEMDGKSMMPILKGDEPIHDSILFGIHGGQGNIYDGRYLFMKGCANEANEPLVNLTLMPTQMRGFMPSKVLKQGELVNGSRFTNGIPVMKYPAGTYLRPYKYGDLLFDMETDPVQEHPIEDHKIKEAMCRKLMAAMDRIEAPKEEFIRLGLRG